MKMLRLFLGASSGCIIWYALQNEKELAVFVAASVLPILAASYLSFRKGNKKNFEPLVFSSAFLTIGVFFGFFGADQWKEFLTLWVPMTLITLAVGHLSDEVVFRTIIEDEENT